MICSNDTSQPTCTYSSHGNCSPCVCLLTSVNHLSIFAAGFTLLWRQCCETLFVCFFVYLLRLFNVRGLKDPNLHLYVRKSRSHRNRFTSVPSVWVRRRSVLTGLFVAQTATVWQQPWLTSWLSPPPLCCRNQQTPSNRLSPCLASPSLG